MEATILNPLIQSDRLVPRISAPGPGPPAQEKELTATEALAKYFEEHTWDKSLRKADEYPLDI